MIRLFLFSLSLALLLVPTVAQAQFTGMKPRIPSDANTLILINAEKMFGSPVADKERWNERRKAAYEAGLSGLPPDAAEVVIAGRSDHEYGKSIWELGMVKLRNERNVTTVAQRFGGTMDNIVGRSAARLPNDHYVVQISPNMMGSYTPANRQDVSRWLRNTDVTVPGGRLSPYLTQAFVYATKVGSPIVMAIDVGGVISEADVRRKAASLESLKDANIPADQLAKLISGTHGATLAISMTDKATGAIRIDFAESPKILGNIGKPLLIEILQRQGAMIDDIHDWTPQISGNSFMLMGNLSTDGARRIMSVLELPRSLSEAMHDASSPGADPEGSAALIATQQYYTSITTLIEDLRVKPKRDHVKTFGQAAMWYDKYSRKIDRFPILNVDEDLLNYGINIAAMFRDCEMAMKGVGMRTSLRTASNNPSSGGMVSRVSGGYRAGTGYHGGMYGVQGMSVGIGAGRASLIEKGRSDAVIRGQERTAGASTVQDIWQGIDESTAAIRRQMTMKYKVEF